MVEMKEKILPGEKDPVKLTVYDGKIRFEVCTGFASIPENAEELLAGSTNEMLQRAKVIRFGDGSADIIRASLIPFGTSDDVIEGMVDNGDTEIEKILGLAVGESVTSGRWWVGHAEDKNDDLLSEDERQFLANAAKPKQTPLAATILKKMVEAAE